MPTLLQLASIETRVIVNQDNRRWNIVRGKREREKKNVKRKFKRKITAPGHRFRSWLRLLCRRLRGRTRNSAHRASQSATRLRNSVKQNEPFHFDEKRIAFHLIKVMLREIRMKYSLMKNDFYGSKKTFLLMKIAPNQAKLIASCHNHPSLSKKKGEAGMGTGRGVQVRDSSSD